MADALSPLDPFLTALRADPDFNRSDERNELESALVRDALITDLITGQGYLDTTLDCLAEQGIDPDAWLGAVVNNIEHVIDAGVRFDRHETGLFLPAVIH
ncbi:hypothetical protein IQ254_10645 [Nodosilinea sp. LEGE 07088]|uniref:hypothetical protein n=1 Tax=Nodosilinea sp. LEGE 07088 TaxID=2777968 RepID=UPI0018820A5F|nr:hypothetical protein [Nodosilinea sp. LEGE 07088]MBE9137667.1 hypothetical protein [Nodosilinea sp. LEGE 07088]